jgi:methionyl-tRNA formyltransferase
VTRTAFYGTPAEAVPLLAALRTVSEVAFVVTQPDRPSGRGLRVHRGPVAEAAVVWGLPVAHEGGAGDLDAMLDGIDVAVVAAYGRLIRPHRLGVPRVGFVNVHFSLLPRWRGASPVVRALLAGDASTGVSLMKMDAGLDTGPVFVQESLPVLAWDSGGSLTARLAALGADMITRHLGHIIEGTLEAAAQDHDRATAAAKVAGHEAFIDPARHRVEAVERAVRAFHPNPAAWSMVDGSRLKILEVEFDDAEVEAGLAVPTEGRVVLGAVGGSVALITVQPEGRRPMAATAWMNGRRGRPARFGRPS